MKIWISEALWATLDDRERSELVEKLQLRAARMEQRRERQERARSSENTESTANPERNAR